jgi:hypothetical protein
MSKFTTDNLVTHLRHLARWPMNRRRCVCLNAIFVWRHARIAHMYSSMSMHLQRFGYILTLGLCALAATPACGGAGLAEGPQLGGAVPIGPEPPAPRIIANPADVRIEMKSGRFNINGVALTDAPTLSEFIALLGPPDRKSPLINRIHTYDRYGILLYEPAGPGGEGGFCNLVSNVTIVLGAEDFAFAPHSVFIGKIVFEGYELERATMFAKLGQTRTAKRVFGDSLIVEGRGHSIFIGEPKNPERGPTSIDLEFETSKPRPAAATAKPTFTPPPPRAPEPTIPKLPPAAPPVASRVECAAGNVNCGTFCCRAGTTCVQATQQCSRVEYVMQCPSGTFSCGGTDCCPYGTSCAGAGMCKRGY